MIKLTPEEHEYWDKKYNEFVKEKIREAEEDVRCGRVYTEEEFWKEMRIFDEQLRRKNQSKREKIKLDLQKDLKRISDKFIRA